MCFSSQRVGLQEFSCFVGRFYVFYLDPSGLIRCLLNMIHSFIFLIPLMILLTACSFSTKATNSPHPENFKRGQVIQDERPLVPANSTDLRELAFTLPMLESQDDLSWYYSSSDSAVSVDRWDLPHDGAQDPATLIRLPRHEDGSQQIELQYSPIPIGEVPTSFSILKRIDGGWLVLKTWKKTVVNKVE